MTLKQHLLSTNYGRGLCLLTVDAIFFGFSDPFKLSVSGLIVAFGLMAVSVYVGIRVVYRIWTLYGLTKPSRHSAMVLTGLFCGLLALQSASQLSVRDILVLMPLTALAYAYMSYTRRSQAI